MNVGLVGQVETVFPLVDSAALQLPAVKSESPDQCIDEVVAFSRPGADGLYSDFDTKEKGTLMTLGGVSSPGRGDVEDDNVAILRTSPLAFAIDDDCASRDRSFVNSLTQEILSGTLELMQPLSERPDVATDSSLNVDSLKELLQLESETAEDALFNSNTTMPVTDINLEMEELGLHDNNMYHIDELPDTSYFRSIIAMKLSAASIDIECDEDAEGIFFEDCLSSHDESEGTIINTNCEHLWSITPTVIGRQALSDKPLRPDLQPEEPILGLQLGTVYSSSKGEGIIEASTLLKTLQLEQSIPALKVAAEAISAPPTNPTSINGPETRVATLKEMLGSLVLDGVDLSDTDPATLRSFIRRNSRTCAQKVLRDLVLAHIINVCMALNDSTDEARAYVAYCKANQLYRRALGSDGIEILARLLDVFPTKPRERHASPTESSVRTTILCQSSQMCIDDIARRVRGKLETNFNVVTLERTLEPNLTFAFDERSGCIIAQLPHPKGSHATSAWCVTIAQWLVTEAHRFSRILIVGVLAKSPPDGATRHAFAKLTMATSMLARPAPETRVVLAENEAQAACLIRSAIDRCAIGIAEWHRGRDGLPVSLDVEHEIQIKFLTHFPDLTMMAAEKALKSGTPVDFLMTKLDHNRLGQVLNQDVSPLPIFPAPSQERRSSQYESKGASEIVNISPEPERLTPIAGLPSEGIPSEFRENPEDTPRTRRRRRIGIEVRPNDKQTRLVYQYLDC